MKKYIIPLFVIVMTTSCHQSPGTGPATASESEIIESVMMGRRSIRKYTDQRIRRDILDEILLCGINAPNGQNRQAYEIRIVDNPETLGRISEAVSGDNSTSIPAGSIFAGAPCVIFIANDTSYDVSQVDCGLLAENIMLSAWARGIGSCCMAAPVRMMKESESCKPFLKEIGFSDGYNPLFGIALGYPDEAPAAKPRKTDMIRYVEFH